MGLGHIYRMLNLADQFKKKGHDVLFFMMAWKTGINKIKEAGWNVIQIPTDSFETVKIYDALLKEQTFDCIVTDALNVSENCMIFFKKRTNILLSLDNTGEGRFISDILLNILYKQDPKLNKPKIEINTFDYLILNEKFRKINKRKTNINKKVKNILITQGGADTYGITPRIIDLLKTMSGDEEYSVLNGASFKHHRNLELSIKKSKLNIVNINNIKNPENLFYNIDIAISGAGMTLFELLCIGVPCITITQEYKELETINYLDKLGLLENVGLYKNIHNTKLSESLNYVINNHKKRVEMSKKGKDAIDGFGSERIVFLIEKELRKIKKA